MMNLTTLFKNLALSELKNHAVSDKLTRTIKEADQESIVILANDALTDLFTKFNLAEKEILVVTHLPYTHYYLRKEFAISNNLDAPVKYLDDNGRDPFEGDVIKILSVYNEYGQELYLNDQEQPLSVFTPQFDCLQITQTHEDKIFSVLYQALHEPLTLDNLDEPFEIPFFLEQAVQSFIAAKVLGGMNGAEHSQKAAEHMSNYEMICSRAEQKDMATTSRGNSNMKLDQRGFV